MSLAALCIQRPVATTLLTIALALVGLLAYINLPVASLPQVEFPSINVQAQLPGASAETMAATVATPLERALGRIAGITEMTSSSSQGATRISLMFDLSREINGAARDVQAAINNASALLPTGMPNQPSYKRINPADSPILILTLTSKHFGRGQMYDVASTILAQKLAQIEGVGQVQISGGALPAVRVELNPFALAKYGIGLEDVRTAITQMNTNRPKGLLQTAQQRWQIQANDQLRLAADYLPLIVAYRQGAPVRISDLGQVIESVEDLRNTGLKNGQPSVLIILTKQPEANVLGTVAKVKALMPQLQAEIPAGMDLAITVDRSLTIEASVKEVEHSLLLSVLLVIVVVLIFLRNIASTLVPVVAVPVSLLGSCAVMYMCGFSLNNLTLMALTISTGFVVDDAIVVLENTSRYIDKGFEPFNAAVLAAKEVNFTVISMSVSLIAVFVPILFMGGVVGRLFREFAVTLSAAVLVSLLVSLTVTPMLCAHWLGRSHAQPGKLSKGLARFFELLQMCYAQSLGWALQHSRIMMLLLIATIVLNVQLYKSIDKGMFPQQDGGRLLGSIQSDQGASFWALHRKLSTFMSIVREDPAIQDVVGFAGNSQHGPSSAQVFVVLKSHAERPPIDLVHERLRNKLARIPGAEVHMFPAQELRTGGRPSFAAYDYVLQADDITILRQWTPKIVAALAKLPQLKDVNSDQQDKGQQISLEVDRALASRYGISQAMIDTTLNNAFGQRQVSVIYNALNQYRVVMELAPEYWESPEVLKQVFIHVPARQMPNGEQVLAKEVPLAAIAQFSYSSMPISVNHIGQFAATAVEFNLKPGVSLSEVTPLIEQTLREIGVPDAIHGSFQGTAKLFVESLKNQPILMLAALVSIYIVLGILYESTIHPLTILSTLPSAGVGALLALMACGQEFNLIAFIGVILLVGIVKKNAIMMIDFAIECEREQHLTPREAIFQACQLRFRPILMTTMAAMFGALPLALGSGYGAELRQPLGISIVGGLIFSQLLTLYTTPVVYVYLDRFGTWLKQITRFKRSVVMPSKHS